MLALQFLLPASLCLLLSGGALAHSATASVTNTLRVRKESPQTTQSDACGRIVDDVNAGYAYHYAVDAHACLMSVPFNTAVANRFIKYINETIQFQSTLEYLRDPPHGYQQPAVDILSELAKIQHNVISQVYRNQYHFEIDVQQLLYSAHDSHLYWNGGITAAFSFLAPYSITAASSDGEGLPQVYITSDIIKGQTEGWKPSPIKEIDGQDVVDYLTRFASLNAFGGIEPHADWNQLFYTPALSTQNVGSIWDSGAMFYPGESIHLLMENGTEYGDYWLAFWTNPYPTGPLTTGGDFYNFFALGLLPSSYDDNGDLSNTASTARNPSESAVTSSSEESWRTISYEAYPDPDVQQEGLGTSVYGAVSGYYLLNENAAVLSIPSFVHSGSSIANFSGAVTEFINEAVNKNLTRVVIDLQQNKGGTVELAFSTFKRFFPADEPFAGSSRRNHLVGNIIGEAYTAFFDGLTPGTDEYEKYLADEWVVTSKLNAASGRRFDSWSEYSGPTQSSLGSSSLTEQFNLSDHSFVSALFEGWVPLGYTVEEPLARTIQPFEAQNIVLLTDSVCSSTCAMLVEMFTQVGVRTVTVGGRPTKGPMQAVGGTRGAVLYFANQIDQHIFRLRNDSIPLNDEASALLPQLTNLGFRDSGVATTSMAINLRNQVRPQDPVPLQFKYEAADCRILYTLDNVWNMSRLWHDTVSAAFDDSSRCVEGSTGVSEPARAAPEPMVESAPLNISLIQSDISLIDEDLDLSGGLQRTTTSQYLNSGNIQYCTPGSDCMPGTQCRRYASVVCDSNDTPQKYLRACLATLSKRDCIGTIGFEYFESSELTTGARRIPGQKPHGQKPSLDAEPIPNSGSSIHLGQDPIPVGLCRPRASRDKSC